MVGCTPTSAAQPDRERRRIGPVFHSLEDAVAFYAERDTRPEKFYPRNSKGEVQRFNDLPAELQAAVNTDAPFGGKHGDKPALNAAEVSDVAAFLRTLTDGFKTTGTSP